MERINFQTTKYPTQTFSCYWEKLSMKRFYWLRSMILEIIVFLSDTTKIKYKTLTTRIIN